MNWTRYLGDKCPIESIYSTEPDLRDIRLHEIRLHQDGPRLSIRLDLNEYPDNPPRKWLTNKFNKVQLTLVLIGISDFTMQGWGLNNIGNVVFQACNDGFRVEFSGTSARIQCEAQFAEIEKLSGYCDSVSTQS